MPSPDIEYRFMRPGEETAACALVKVVFDQYIASDLGPEGIAEFLRFANPQAMAARSGPEQVLVVALHASQLVGVLEIRTGSHLALLFVSLKGRGVARELLRIAIIECRARQPHLAAITVNASLYAQAIYQRLGFKDTGPARTVNGIVHVPMALALTEA